MDKIERMTKLQLLCLKVRDPNLTKLQLARIDNRIKLLDAPRKIREFEQGMEAINRFMEAA
jgi:hypothetical protein